MRCPYSRTRRRPQVIDPNGEGSRRQSRKNGFAHELRSVLGAICEALLQPAPVLTPSRRSSTLMSTGLILLRPMVDFMPPLTQ